MNDLKLMKAKGGHSWPPVNVLEGSTMFNAAISAHRPQLCDRQGIWKTSSPELQPIKDTEVENIFCCSSVFDQPDMSLTVALR